MSNLAAPANAAPASPIGGREGAAAVTTRRVNGRTFVLRDSVWTDVRYQPQSTMSVTSIKPYSKAYFDVVDQLPELRAVFALGARVAVVGRSGAIVLNDTGASELTSAALTTLVRGW